MRKIYGFFGYFLGHALTLCFMCHWFESCGYAPFFVISNLWKIRMIRFQCQLWFLGIYGSYDVYVLHGCSKWRSIRCRVSKLGKIKEIPSVRTYYLFSPDFSWFSTYFPLPIVNRILGINSGGWRVPPATVLDLTDNPRSQESIVANCRPSPSPAPTSGAWFFAANYRRSAVPARRQ